MFVAILQFRNLAARDGRPERNEGRPLGSLTAAVAGLSPVPAVRGERVCGTRCPGNRTSPPATTSLLITGMPGAATIPDDADRDRLATIHIGDNRQQHKHNNKISINLFINLYHLYAFRLRIFKNLC